MSVSGTPDRPNPPHRMVLLLGISSIAASAEGKILLTSNLVLVEENNRASRSVYNKRVKLALFSLGLSRKMRGTHFSFWRADDKSGGTKRIHCRNHCFETQRLTGWQGLFVLGMGGKQFDWG